MVGRDEDIAAVAGGLARSPLITVTGPGGCGKTRLALAVGERLRPRFQNGAVFAALTDVSDASGVAAEFARLFGVQDRPVDELLPAVLHVVRPMHLLLVVDNCEQVAGPVAEVLAALLGQCPDLRVIATSRRPLGLDDEALHQLRPLRLPSGSDVDNAAASDAVTLFAERVRLRRADYRPEGPELETVADIVRSVEGLPLAIELAAARAATLGAAEVLRRLRTGTTVLRAQRIGGDRRHVSIAATVEWSYALLRPVEQRAVRVLSILPSAFSLAAAEALLGPEAGDHLGVLVDHSWLTLEPSGPGVGEHYRCLYVLRTFARQQASDQSELHIAYERLVAWAVARTSGERPVDDVEGEVAAVAAEWALANDRLSALHITLGLSGWRTAAGRLTEAMTALAAGLDEPPAASAYLLARAYRTLARLASTTGDLDAAARAGADAEQVLVRAGDTVHAARARAWRAFDQLNATARVDADLLRALTAQGGAPAGDPSFRALREMVLVLFALGNDDPPSARSHLESLSKVDERVLEPDVAASRERVLLFGSRRVGDVPAVEAWSQVILHSDGDSGTRGFVLIQQAWLHVASGAQAAAVAAAREARALGIETNNRMLVADALAVLVAVAADAADLPTAARLYGAAGQAYPGLSVEPRAVATALLCERSLGGAFAAYVAAGARLPEDAIDELINERLPSNGTAGAVARRPAAPHLSARERELLALVADGLTDADIARALYISVATVRSHLDRIRDRTGARRRAELTRLALSLPG